MPSASSFRNRSGGALVLENLADRFIKPVLKANGLEWKGWHAYRRGLATNLNLLGVPDNIKGSPAEAGSHGKLKKLNKKPT
jgi:hypothetical protein